LLNARRHLAKQGRTLPLIPRIDPASSGRWFSGWRRGAPPSHDPPAVAAPRTWLLSVGWRRRGLIDAAEVPGFSRRRRSGLLERCWRSARPPASRPRGA
jgi:hypothetical protein